MKLKAVFLDKDGNLIPDLSAGRDYDLAELNENFVEGLQLLQSHGYLLVIVSGKTGENETHGREKLEEFRKSIQRSCSNMGIYLDGFYYGPQQPESGVSSNGNTGAHLPEAKLLQKAAGDMDIDLSKSWMIGDLLNDIEAGYLVGCNTVFVNDGRNIPVEKNNIKVLASDLADAARKIVTTSLSKTRSKTKKKAVVA